MILPCSIVVKRAGRTLGRVQIVADMFRSVNEGRDHGQPSQADEQPQDRHRDGELSALPPHYGRAGFHELDTAAPSEPVDGTKLDSLTAPIVKL